MRPDIPRLYVSCGLSGMLVGLCLSERHGSLNVNWLKYAESALKLVRHVNCLDVCLFSMCALTTEIGRFSFSSLSAAF